MRQFIHLMVFTPFSIKKMEGPEPEVMLEETGKSFLEVSSEVNLMEV